MTTRVVVIADTHMPRKGRQCPLLLLEHLGRADTILHLGDFTSMEVVAFLESYAPLSGVHGNNDSEDVRLRFPAQQELFIEGQKLVLIHGDVGGHTALAAARAVHTGDAVLFGHSHQAFCSWENERLLFNPGSPTDRRWSPCRSFGILTIDDRIEASVVPLP